jgi:protein TonB
MAEQNRNRRRLVSRIAIGASGAVLMLGFVYFVSAMMSKKAAQPQRLVQTIQIIRPPPPPPPDQPPPPPPEKTEDALPKDEPEPVPDNQQAPDQPLGIDAEGAAGGDAFGLAARRGGSDLIGGTGSAPFAWYTNRISDAIRERLAGTPCTRSAKGSLSVHLWVAADGRVRQVKLATTTGNTKTDECIDTALAGLTRMSDPPPPGLPEEVTLKIVSRI